MGYEGYAILGYRKGKISEVGLYELEQALMATYCRTETWMKWYGYHVEQFDEILLRMSSLADFFLLVIGEEGSMLEVISYSKGKKRVTEISMLGLELFSGYSYKELNKLKTKVYERIVEKYDNYRKKIQEASAKALKLTRIYLRDKEAPSENEDEKKVARPIDRNGIAYKWQYEEGPTYKDFDCPTSDLIERHYLEYLLNPHLKDLPKGENSAIGKYELDCINYTFKHSSRTYNIRRVGAHMF